MINYKKPSIQLIKNSTISLLLFLSIIIITCSLEPNVEELLQQVTSQASQQSYTVTFSRNDGSKASMATYVVKSPATTVGAANMPTPPVRANFTFDGWNTQADGTGNVFNGATTVTRNITVYAKWTLLLINFTVTPYNDAGSTKSLDFVLSRAPAKDLAADDITIDDSTGEVVKGSLIKVDNNIYTLEITATNPKAIEVAINNHADISTNPISIYLLAPVVEAAMPVFVTKPQSKTDYSITDTAVPLEARATVNDGGTVTYQWFRNTVNSTTDGTPIGTGTSYTPPVNTAGTFYYYVIATNTNDFATGNKTAARISNVVVITSILNSYIVTFDSNDGSQASMATYIVKNPETTVGAANMPAPPVRANFTFDSWNTRSDGTGTVFNGTTTVTGNITVYAKWTPVPLVNAAVPVFTTQPQSKTDYFTTSTAVPMVVRATVNDGGTVTYQWFRNTANRTTGGTSVGTGTSYTPPVNTAGTFYYYVIATNTNNSVTGNKTATGTSNVATITSIFNPSSDNMIFKRDEVINDMVLKNEGIPHGAPDTTGWKFGPVITAGKNIPEGFSAAIAWGCVYADQDQPNPDIDFPNARVHIKDLELYIYLKDGTWKLINSAENPSGALYVEDFKGDVNKPADIKRETAGGISVQAGSGFTFHYWNSKREIDANNIAGVFVVCKARLIGTENYQTVPKYLVNVGGDYWKDLQATYVPEWWTVNNGIANGRFKYVTPEWQYFTMHTFNKDEVKNIKFPLE